MTDPSHSAPAMRPGSVERAVRRERRLTNLLIAVFVVLLVATAIVGFRAYGSAGATRELAAAVVESRLAERPLASVDETHALNARLGDVESRVKATHSDVEELQRDRVRWGRVAAARGGPALEAAARANEEVQRLEGALEEIRDRQGRLEAGVETSAARMAEMRSVVEHYVSSETANRSTIETRLRQIEARDKDAQPDGLLRRIEDLERALAALREEVRDIRSRTVEHAPPSSAPARR